MAAFELGIIFSSMGIDVVTLFIKKIQNLCTKLTSFLKKNNNKDPPIIPKKHEVSVIIPVYNEERNIKKTIEFASNQTIPPKEVIVVDDASTDRTPDIVRMLQRDYPNLVYIRQPENRGKATNINRALSERDLPEITLVLDADTFLTKTYIEDITKPFADSKVAIVCGVGFLIGSESRIGMFLDNGKEYQFNVFLFRKKAQAIRNAISVISGDSAAYRTEFLKKIGGIPKRTQTEDTDVTWIAIEEGYKVKFQESAMSCYRDTESVVGHFRQVFRWYCGIVQCLFVHGRRIFKSKSLSLTTILPTLIDTFVYTPIFLLIPFLSWYHPFLAFGFLFADLLFTFIFSLLLYKPKNIAEIYFIKLLWGLAWIMALFKTTKEYISKKRDSWGKGWGKSRDTKPKSDYMLKIGLSIYFFTWFSFLFLFLAFHLNMISMI